MKFYISIIFSTISFIFSQNSALLFDGHDDYVEVGTNSSFESIVNQLTLTSYVKLSVYSSESTIIAKRNFVGNPNGERHHFQFGINENGGLFFSTANNQNNDLYSAQIETESGLINTNQLYFVAVTFDNGLIKFYIDQDLVHEYDFGYREMYPNNHWINFGRVHRSGGQAFFGEFEGTISSPSIWNRALSQSELISFQDSDNEYSNAEGLIGFWDFQNQSLSCLTDFCSTAINYGAIWVESVNGCTDELAENYDSSANNDDGSCTYLNNGDYSLKFDGIDDYVNHGNVLHMGSSFSVGAWAYSNGGNGVILSKHLFDIDSNQPWGKYTGYILGNMNGEGLRLEIVNDWQVMALDVLVVLENQFLLIRLSTSGTI